MIPSLKLIAMKYKAEITLLHVVDPVFTVPEIGIFPPAVLPLPEWLISQQAEKLERFGKDELAGFPVRRLVHEGEPEAQIVAVAHADSTQLIVMPTHGYGKLRKFLLGSITSKVLHDVECPMLTGSHLEVQGEDEMPKIASVVCAIDLGPTSCDVLTWAARMSSDFHACLSVVHAIPRFYSVLNGAFSPNIKEQLELSIRHEIETLQALVGAKDTTVYICDGDTAHSVCSFAASVGADLLVIGRRRDEDSAGRLRGNAYQIIRESACPVLSV